MSNTSATAKPLLDIAHPAYIRRLVREINNLLDNGTGVYFMPVGAGTNVRIKRASYRYSDGLSRVSVRTLTGSSSFYADPDRFVDGYGRSIVATRQP